MNPIQYSPANQKVVDSFNDFSDEQNDHLYWGNELVKRVRKQIKDHYIEEQRQRCCYCNVEIPTKNNAVWDAEHIISRNLAARFMFEPRNLAVSCKDCNSAKSDDEVRVNPKRKSFPDESKHYIIVHPHFDTYRDHISWYGKVVVARSKKGINLITMCNLMRFSLAKIDENSLPQSPLFEKLVGTFMDPHATTDEMSMANAAIGDYLKKKPQN